MIPRLNRTIPLALVLLAFLFLPIGCVGPRRAAYISVGTISATVTTLMDVWGEETELGHTTPQFDATVLAYYKQFQVVAAKAKIVQRAIYAGTQTDDSILPLLEELSKNRRLIADMIYTIVTPEKKAALQKLP
jgi:hypothetical protein